MKNVIFLSFILLLITATALGQEAKQQKKSVLDKITDALDATERVVDAVKGKENKSEGQVKNETGEGLSKPDEGLNKPNSSNSTKAISPHPDLSLKFVDCVSSGNTLFFDFILNNKGEDADFRLYGSSNDPVCYDDEGNSYSSGIYVKLGQNQGEQFSYTTLPTGIPVKCRVQINKMASGASSIARINMRVFSETLGLSNDKYIVFQNIPIRKSE